MGMAPAQPCSLPGKHCPAVGLHGEESTARHGTVWHGMARNGTAWAALTTGSSRTNHGHQTWQNTEMVVKAHSHHLAPFRVLLMEWES